MSSISNFNAYSVLWITYFILLSSSILVAYRERKNVAFLSANGTQTAIPLALNFIASGIGCGSLSAYPQIANIDGIHGLLVYALAGGLPMMIFAFLGPIIKKKTPDGFVLTEWVFQRFGLITGCYLSACTLLTVFLFMVSDVAALKYALSSISNVSVVRVVIVEAIVTTIYTSMGGFHISFLTDSLQVTVVFILFIIVSVAVGKYIEIDTSKIKPSGLLQTNKLGWQLVYILTLAIFTNDFFMSGFWLRTFAAKTNKDLLIACSIACVIVTFFSIIVGSTGLLSVWAGLMPVSDKERSGAAFYVLLSQLPSPLIGLTLVIIAILSTCSFDSLQSAMVSSISNDLFRNRISIKYARLLVVLVIIPVLFLGLVAEDILKIYLFVDLLSSSVVPVLVIGLWKRMDDIWTGWEVIGGGLGGLLSVWIFGAVYFKSVKDGLSLLFISRGLYVEDWSTFGAFVAAPIGGLFVAFTTLYIRLACMRMYDVKYSKFHHYCNMVNKFTGVSKVRDFINTWENEILFDTARAPQKESDRVKDRESSEPLLLHKIRTTAVYHTDYPQ